MTDPINLSKYVTLHEATYSATAEKHGINNTPPAELMDSLKAVCVNVFDKVREHFGVPLRVSSGYRCPEVNNLVGSKPGSQHTKGEALDIQPMGNSVTVQQIFDYVVANLDYDQCIIEGTAPGQWCHVSYKATGNRKQHFAILNP